MTTLHQLRKCSNAERKTLRLEACNLAAGYHALVAQAPRRMKPYLSRKRTGVAPPEQSARRLEERLAMALFNLGEIRFGNGERLKCLDYQFPLKAVRADAGIGKIDLLGVTEQSDLAVIELKGDKSTEDRRIGLLEGLVYSAIVEANVEKIAVEVATKHGCHIATSRPVIMIVGPARFWSNSNAFPPTDELQGLVKNVEAAIPIKVMMLRLDNSEMTDCGRTGSAPRLPDNAMLSPVAP